MQSTTKEHSIRWLADTPADLQTGEIAPKLAYQNLVHDRLSLFVTLIGVVFQFCSSPSSAASTSIGTHDRGRDRSGQGRPVGRADRRQEFDDASLLTGREKYAVLSTPGMQSVKSWSSALPARASGRRQEGLHPGRLGFEEWRPGALEYPGGQPRRSRHAEFGCRRPIVLPDLGITKIGQSAETNTSRVTVTAVTKGIRRSRRCHISSPRSAGRVSCRRAPEQAPLNSSRYSGTNVDALQKTLAERLPDTEVLKHAEFRDRSLKYWLFKTGTSGA